MTGPCVALHRFRDCAQIAILGTGGAAVYLTAGQARKLSRDLARLCRSLENESFLDSEYVQEHVPASLEYPRGKT